MIPRLTIFIVLAVLATPVAAQEFNLGSLSITVPWSRELPPVAPNGAAFFRVENHGANADRIVSAHTPIAERAELHMHAMDGNVMTMRHVHSVEVPAHGTVSFEPGALHVMLFGLREPLVGGKRFPLTLEFEQAGEVEVSVEIRGSAAASGADHGSHEHERGGHEHGSAGA